MSETLRVLTLGTELHDARANARLLVDACAGASHIYRDSQIEDPELLFDGLENLPRELAQYLDELNETVEAGHIGPRKP